MLIVGLGNPGTKYAATRHNIGFLWLDHLFSHYKLTQWHKKYHGLYATFVWGQKKYHLLKPETFMNSSGQSLLAAMTGLKIRPEDILVAHDDLDLTFGTIRAKVGGGAGGNNGIRSIIASIGDVAYQRLRFGIGHPGDRAQVTDYVLSRFHSNEKVMLPTIFSRATTFFELWQQTNFAKAVEWLHTLEKSNPQ